MPEQDILLDDTSRTTKENAENSVKLLASGGLHRPIVITSAFHMPRAVQHFRKQGAEVIPYPVGYLVSQPSEWRLTKLVPSSGGIDLLSTAVKEYMGLLQAK
ncbi:YdcF family protein [Paenibacillus sp. P26]|nr:YdcF family protein [Paenibacillus sp. P26]